MTCQSGAITPKVGGVLMPQIHTPQQSAQDGLIIEGEIIGEKKEK